MLKKICGFLSGILLIVLAALAGILIIPKVMGYEEMAVLTAEATATKVSGRFSDICQRRKSGKAASRRCHHLSA